MAENATQAAVYARVSIFLSDRLNSLSPPSYSLNTTILCRSTPTDTSSPTRGGDR